MDTVEAELDNLLAEFDADSGGATTAARPPSKAPAARPPPVAAAVAAQPAVARSATPTKRAQPAVASGPVVAGTAGAAQPRTATPTRATVAAVPNRAPTPNRQTQPPPGSNDLEALLNELEVGPAPAATGALRPQQQQQPRSVSSQVLTPQSAYPSVQQPVAAQVLQPQNYAQGRPASLSNPSQVLQPQNYQQQQQPQQLKPQNLQAQNYQPQQAQTLQPQNYQPQQAQTLQPQNYQPQQAQTLQPQNYQSPQQLPHTLQPQNYQQQQQQQRPQSLQPQNALQPQNYQQQPQTLQPQNYQQQQQQPQTLQPQNYQQQQQRPQSVQLSQQEQDRRTSYSAGNEPDFESLNDDLALLGINDLADSVEQKMETMGFVPLSNEILTWDEDSNTASDFKISGVTNTRVGEVHDIVLRPLSNDQPCNIKSPQKYISVHFEHEAGVPVKSWIRDNDNCTYSLGFCCNTSGKMNMSICLMGQQLFKLPIFISPGGDEKQWVVRAQQPVLARTWVMSITRVDGQMPQGRHPFEVQTTGNIENVAIAPIPGGYQVTALPVGTGSVTVTIQLFGSNIIGSPLHASIVDPLVGNQPVQVASFGVPGGFTGAQARPQNAINLQPVNRPPTLPQNATAGYQQQPQNVRTPQPQNVTNFQPQNAVNLQPHNMGGGVGGGGGVHLQPQNTAGVNNLQPQNVGGPQNVRNLQPQNSASMQPQNARNLQPQNVVAMQPQNVRPQPQQQQRVQPQNVRSTTPQNTRPPPSNQPRQTADDALADLLNELEQY